MAYEKKILTFHYVWYKTRYGPAGEWGAWTEGGYNPDIIIRGQREIDAPHYPLDGPYDSCDPVVINRQLEELQFAGIDGSILSWWGLGDYSDQALTAILEQAAGTNYGVTIYYETPMVARRREEGQSVADRIYADLNALLVTHSAKPNWITVHGRPVVVLYVVGTYEIAVWEEVKDRLRADGFDPFFLGDTFDPDYLAVMDGLHTYNPIGITMRGDALDEPYARACQACHAQGKLFAATAVPGYDDRKIRTPGVLVARGDGSYFRETWRAAAASGADWVLITSYNEWHEGSEIEPSREYGKDYLFLTRQLAAGFKS